MFYQFIANGIYVNFGHSHHIIMFDLVFKGLICILMFGSRVNYFEKDRLF